MVYYEDIQGVRGGGTIGHCVGGQTDTIPCVGKGKCFSGYSGTSSWTIIDRRAEMIPVASE